MKKVTFLCFVALMTSLAACNKNSGPSKENPEDKIISLSTSILNGGISKSPSLDQNGEGNFSEGDTFSLLISNADNNYDSFSYTVGKTQLFWKDVKVENDGKVIFSACYPEQEAVDGKFEFDLNSAGYTDLLVARKTDVAANDETPIDLVFRHAMHRLKIKFTAEEGISTDEIVTKCTAESVCSVNLLDGAVAAVAGHKAVFSRQGKEVEFIIAPQKASDVTLQISIGEIERTVAVNELKPDIDELEGGMQLSVELTIKNGKIEIGNIAIEGWENQGTIGGEIIL